MYKIARYRETDRMYDLICDNYPVLLVLSRFNIPLGFGDKTIEQVCGEAGVDSGTLMAVVNLLAGPGGQNHKTNASEIEKISVPSLIVYLRNSHDYFLGFQLPAIRKKLTEATGGGRSDVSRVIIRFFDAYVAEVEKHMHYEDLRVFPYVERLLQGHPDPEYNIRIFSRQHDQVEAKLSELKDIIIKYCPTSGSNNLLNSVLFDIFTCAADLASHNTLEDTLFVPAIAALEKKVLKITRQ